MMRPSACCWLVLAVACSPENQIKSLDPNDPGPTVPSDPDTTPGTTESDTTPDETTPTTPTETTPTPPSGCAAPVSWRDSQPALPAAVAQPNNLPAGAGIALATCTNDPAHLTDEADTEFLTTDQAHVGGQWYFEVKAETYVPGWSTVGVFAEPAGYFDVTGNGNPGTYPWSAAGTYLAAPVVGVLADLDAGVVSIYEDGVRVDQRDVSLDPGVGAFHAGGVSMVGNALRFNYGSEPFEYDPPAGYAAWSTGGAGNCPSDVAVPAPPAPIVLDPAFGNAGTTFESNAADVIDLVMVGLYDSGSDAGWDWGPNGVPVPNGNQQNGAATVHLDRTSPTTLVLTAYEPTDWTLDVDANADLRSVVVLAMHPQTVTGAPAGVPVDIHTICSNGSGGWCTAFTGTYFQVGSFQWPFDVGGGSTQDQVDLAEQATCLPLKLFGGIYETQDITIGN